MDGVLLVDKPSGPTSHDVVIRLRRSSGERSVGHTGTLDPLATGLLPLVFGRATRLASFLTSGEKIYEATIRLGYATDTHDAAGQQVGTACAGLPAESAIDDALDRFRGTFEQQPPAHSAKHVDGQRAYSRARRQEPVELAPVSVTVHSLDRLSRIADLLTIRLRTTAGFYVRALARDLGAQLGCGAHLVRLRRLGSGPFGLDRAVTLDEAERAGTAILGHLISPAAALPGLPAVELTEAGLRRAVHGNPLKPEHLSTRLDLFTVASAERTVRVIGPEGRLIALAEARAGTLHPVVVLG
jgi:tRNA pseudouridine55 synthase